MAFEVKTTFFQHHPHIQLLTCLISVIALGHTYCILCWQIKGFNSSITTILFEVVVIELWLGNYSVVALLAHFYRRNRFVYSINVLNFKGVSSVNTSLSVKCNKTLKALPLHLYENIQLLVRVSCQI